MRLLVVGLALMVGGAWGQSHFSNIEKEPLGLPSDYFEHHDVEQKSVGSGARTDVHHHYLGDHSSSFASVGQLPFGVRIPGYDRVHYSYGYTVSEEPNPNRPQIQLETAEEARNQLASSGFHSVNFPDPQKTIMVSPGTEYLTQSAVPPSSVHLIPKGKIPSPSVPLPLIDDYLSPDPKPRTDPSPNTPMPVTDPPMLSPVIPEAESTPDTEPFTTVTPAESLPPVLQPHGVRGKQAADTSAPIKEASPSLLQETDHITVHSEPSVKQPIVILAEQHDQPMELMAEMSSGPPLEVIEENATEPVVVQEDLTTQVPVRALPKYQPHIHNTQSEGPDLLPVMREEQHKVTQALSKEPSRLRDSVVVRGTPYPSSISVFSKTEDNAVGARSFPPQEPVAVINRDKPECSQSRECSDYEVCVNEKCVDGCVIAEGVCVGNAQCRTRRHTPACVCLDMSVSVTVYIGGRQAYDCKPTAMSVHRSRPGLQRPVDVSGRILNRGRQPQISEVGGTFHNSHRTDMSSERVDIFQREEFDTSRNPCQPSPCGSNTRCETARSGGIAGRNTVHARCRCLEGFVPNGNTIVGCKYQCLDDRECPDDYQCRGQKCVRVCEAGACGINADCEAVNHKPRCSCPPGFRGNPESRCSREQIEVRDAPEPLEVDPCFSSPCGENADCRDERSRAVCTCPFGYSGDPLTRCNRGECTENDHCSPNKVCQGLKCIDPCSDRSMCGANSNCQVRNHQVICTCISGYVGDAVRGCDRFDPATLCNPSPCGQNTNCKVKDGRAVCSCFVNYRGDPLTKCIPDCERNEDCSSSQTCRNNVCVNPCSGNACGENAICEVRNYQAICRCPEYYSGDPYNRCTAQCFDHDDCPNHQACSLLKCINPCEGACGERADCKVNDHQPICSCPRGMTGHPFERCRPFTDEDFCKPNPCGDGANCQPGTDRSGVKKAVCTCPHGYIGNPLSRCTKGQCTQDNECPGSQTCFLFECKDPCVGITGSVCGENAKCIVRDRKPVCSCPVGYTGDARQACSPAPHSRGRFSLGRFK
nr:neurogenic locus notch homolog protein 4-like [Cherax quadricarinatus]